MQLSEKNLKFKKNNTPKALSFDVKFEKIEEDNTVKNPLFTRCKCYVMYVGKNRNNSNISKEAVEKALPTLGLCPVIGDYDKGIEGFTGHGGKIVINQNTDEITIQSTTIPYGVVNNNPNTYWEMVTEDNGQIHEYLVCEDIYLWTSRYPQIEEALNNSDWQSMEIEDIDGEFDAKNQVLNINSFIFSALCILGRDSMNEDRNFDPCFESSHIENYSLSKDEFKKEFTLMMNELKINFTNNEEVYEDMANKSKKVETSKEEVETKEFEKEPVSEEVVTESPKSPVEEFKKTTEKEDKADTETKKEEKDEESKEDPKEEATETPDEEAKEEVEEEKVETSDEKKKEGKKYDENSNEIDFAGILNKLQQSIEDVYACIKESKEDMAKKSKKEDKADTKDEKVGDEMKDDVKEEGKEGEDKAPDFPKFSDEEVEGYKLKITSLEETNANLLNQIAEFEKEKKSQEIDKVFAKSDFAMMVNDEEVIKLKEEAINMEIAQLEEKLFAIKGRKINNFSRNKKTQMVGLGLDTYEEKKSDNEPVYAERLKQYVQSKK